MQTILAFPFLNVYLHEGPLPAIETHWLGYVPGTEFRAAVEQVVQLARQHGVKGWIADDRLLGAVRPRDLQWTHEEVLLAIDNLGVQRFAHLESQDALNRLTIAAMYERATAAGVSFAIRRFEDVQLARAWASGKE